MAFEKTVEIHSGHMSPKCIAAYPECTVLQLSSVYLRLANHSFTGNVSRRWNQQSVTVQQSISSCNEAIVVRLRG